MKKYIKGNFRKTIFKSDDGFRVGIFKIKETNIKDLEDHINRSITFTGYFAELNEDDNYIFYGETLLHPKYGFQFSVKEYEKVKPTDRVGVIEFLSSDLFSGVGEKLASSIVNTLGNDCLDKILKDKSVLEDVPKMNNKLIDHIYNVLRKYDESHQIIVSLTDMGFSMKESLLIYNHYGSNTDYVIENNIYKLYYDIKELTFTKIDRIALDKGISEDDDERVKAFIIYFMNALIFRNSDVYLDKETICNGVINNLRIDVSADKFDDYFYELSKDKLIKIDGDAYYLYDLFEDENYVVEKLYRLIKKKPKNINIDKLLKELEKKNNIDYNGKQEEAIRKSMEDNILIITGGPGTGKTTIIKTIVQVYQKLNKLNSEKLIDEIALLAPTGRAAKRMSSSTNLPASTIHRFLKWDKSSNTFMIDEKNKDYSKLIIVDESSMIDISLFASLLRGLTENIKLILVGDYDQLPSVGPGQVLRDLIESDVIDIVHLDRLYRQSEKSFIPTLASEIRDGDVSDFKEPRGDYVFLECLGSSIRRNMVNLCKQIVSKGYSYMDVQFLAPMYKGENGIDKINEDLQNVFNPKSKDKNEVKYGDVIYREHDKVLQLENMPDKNVFNGDLGIIESIISHGKERKITINFDGNEVEYKTKDLNKIKHGFIISIHKAQGSEFDIVVMPICSSYRRMLYRKLIYTGVTRAKRRLIIVGEANAFIECVKNNNEYIRKSKLKDKLVHKFA